MQQWSRESIIFALQRWVEIHGDVPTVKVLSRVDSLPSQSVVKHYFGSLRAGVIAAGFQPRGRGCPNQIINPPVRDRGKFVPYRRHNEYV